MPLGLPDLASRSALLQELLERVREVAGQINRAGWAEANAGNISINITDIATPVYPYGKEGEQVRWYIVSRTGSRYRDLARYPLPHLLLISLSDGAETVYPPDANPTSEWTCHRLLQQRLNNAHSDCRVVLHAHPDSVILLSQLDIYKQPVLLNKALRKALPEFALYLPEGVATAQYAPPGSQELANCSLDAIGNARALIWQGHGLLTLAPDCDLALDLMQVAEKAARLLLERFRLTKNWL